MRYPRPLLLPAVVEAGGRWGKEFRRWARAALPESKSRAMQLADLRQRIAVALMRGVAAALLASAASTRRPWLPLTHPPRPAGSAASGS